MPACIWIPLKKSKHSKAPFFCLIAAPPTPGHSSDSSDAGQGVWRWPWEYQTVMIAGGRRCHGFLIRGECLSFCQKDALGDAGWGVGAAAMWWRRLHLLEHERGPLKAELVFSSEPAEVGENNEAFSVTVSDRWTTVSEDKKKSWKTRIFFIRIFKILLFLHQTCTTE